MPLRPRRTCTTGVRVGASVGEGVIVVGVNVGGIVGPVGAGVGWQPSNETPGLFQNVYESNSTPETFQHSCWFILSALRNMLAIVVTAPMSHGLMSWLNDLA